MICEVTSYLCFCNQYTMANGLQSILRRNPFRKNVHSNVYSTWFAVCFLWNLMLFRPCPQELAWKRVMSALRAITLRSGVASPAAAWDITWRNKRQTTETSKSPVKSQYFTTECDIWESLFIESGNDAFDTWRVWLCLQVWSYMLRLRRPGREELQHLRQRI